MFILFKIGFFFLLKINVVRITTFNPSKIIIIISSCTLHPNIYRCKKTTMLQYSLHLPHNVIILGLCDAYWKWDIDNRRSTIGFLLLVNEVVYLVQWKTTNNSIVNYRGKICGNITSNSWTHVVEDIFLQSWILGIMNQPSNLISKQRKNLFY
jgi:hypothetical protein